MEARDARINNATAAITLDGKSTDRGKKLPMERKRRIPRLEQEFKRKSAGDEHRHKVYIFLRGTGVSFLHRGENKTLRDMSIRITVKDMEYVNIKESYFNPSIKKVLLQTI